MAVQPAEETGLRGMDGLLAERAGCRTLTPVCNWSLKLLDARHLLAGGAPYELGRYGRRALAHLARVPLDLLNRCQRSTQAQLLEELYHEQVQRGQVPEPLGLVVADGARVVGMTDGRLALLSGREVLGAVLEAAPRRVQQHADLLGVPHCRANHEISFSLVYPAFTAEPRPGDGWLAGIEALHWDGGEEATQISSFLLRGATATGILVHVYRAGKRLRIRRVPDKDKLLEQVRRLASLAWDDLGRHLRALKSLTAKAVDDPAAELEYLARRYRLELSREARDGLKRTFRRETRDAGFASRSEAATSAYDLVTTLARFALEARGRSADWRRSVMALGGDLVLGRARRRRHRRHRRR